MHPVEAARLAAFAAVTIDDYDAEYFYRHVFRWYSKEFHTPLSDVYDLPLDFVLQHYWEARYEAMDDAKRVAERDRLRETEEQAWKRMLREEADRADADEYAAQVAAEEAQRLKEEAEKTVKGDKKTLTPATSPIRSLLADAKAPPSFPVPDPSAPPPDIKMTFVDDEEMDAILEGYGAVPHPIRPPKQS